MGRAKKSKQKNTRVVINILLPALDPTKLTNEIGQARGRSSWRFQVVPRPYTAGSG